MPKQKSKPVISDSESDSGPEDRNPPAKKAKGNESKEKSEPETASKSSKSKSEENPLDQTWNLDKNRRVSLNSYRGKLLVDIREYYMDKNGESKPGKKGISLNMAQWNALKSHITEIDKALEKAS